MKRLGSMSALLGAVAGIVLFSAVGVLMAQTGGRSSCCVASVDVVKTFNEYQRQKDLTEELRQRQSDLESENQRRRQQIDSAQAAVDAMDPTDPAAMARGRELLAMQIDYKTWADLNRADMEREMGLWTARVYQEIVAAVEEVAKQQGYDMVLYREEFQPLAELQRVREQIGQRKVVYASQATNITQSVLDKLNADYRAKPRQKMLGGAGAGPTPAPGVATPPAGPPPKKN